MYIVRRKETPRIYQNKKKLKRQLEKDLRRLKNSYNAELYIDGFLDKEIIEVVEVKTVTVREFLGQ